MLANLGRPAPPLVSERYLAIMDAAAGAASAAGSDADVCSESAVAGQKRQRELDDIEPVVKRRATPSEVVNQERETAALEREDMRSRVVELAKNRTTLSEVVNRNRERDALQREDVHSQLVEAAARRLVEAQKRERDALQREDVHSQLVEAAARLREGQKRE
jgi:hypothetical protein